MLALDAHICDARDYFTRLADISGTVVIPENTSQKHLPALESALAHVEPLTKDGVNTGLSERYVCAKRVYGLLSSSQYPKVDADDLKAAAEICQATLKIREAVLCRVAH